MAPTRYVKRGRYGGMMLDVEGLERLDADLHDFERRLPLAIRASLRGEGGEALASAMRSGAPRRSGTLVAGIGVHPQPGGAVLVGYQGALAGGAVVNAREQRGVWVESGTKPHSINPRRKKALAFFGSVVEEVRMHPGSRAQKVAFKAMRTAEWEVLADVTDKLDEIA